MALESRQAEQPASPFFLSVSQMTSVVLLTARWCNICPSVKVFWRELKSSEDFEYEEVDAESEKGMKLVERYSIATVPTSIVDRRVLLRGVPIYEQVEKLLNLRRKLLESVQ